MPPLQETITVSTRARGPVEITAQVADIVRRSRVTTGLCVVFCRHTSASLVIQENADPSARADVMDWLERAAPDGDPHYAHTAEGPDDSPAHIRSTITKTSETIPVVAGALALGTWQGLYLLEHRTHPHTRQVVVHVDGE